MLFFTFSIYLKISLPNIIYVMKYIYNFICLLSFFVLISCEQELLISDVDSNEKLCSNDVRDKIALATDTLEIVEFKVHPDSIKKKANKRNISSYMRNSTEYLLSENLYNLDDYPFLIRSSVGTNKYLSVSSAGKEVVLLNYSKPSNTTYVPSQYRFYVKNLPSTSGIPYLMYSQATKTPLSVGQYSSNPNEKIMFARPNNNGDLYSASWDIFHSSSYDGSPKSNGSIVIESQALLESNPNNYWDVYNLVLCITNNKARYSKYNKYSNQEFIIEPIGDFTVDEIEYIDDYSISATKHFLKIPDKEIPNESSFMTNSEVFKYDYYVSESSDFLPNQGINVKLIGDNLFIHPIIEDDGTVTLNPRSVDYKVPYSTVARSWSKCFAIEEPVLIPPLSKAVLSVELEYYDLEINYVATSKCGEAKLKIGGKWKGRIYMNRANTNARIYSLTNNQLIKNVSTENAPLKFKIIENM